MSVCSTVCQHLNWRQTAESVTIRSEGLRRKTSLLKVRYTRLKIINRPCFTQESYLYIYFKVLFSQLKSGNTRADQRQGEQCWLRHVWADQSEQTRVFRRRALRRRELYQSVSGGDSAAAPDSTRTWTSVEYVSAKAALFEITTRRVKEKKEKDEES